MEKRTSKKIKILIAASIIFIISGLGFILYQYFINVFVKIEQEAILEKWDKNEDILSDKISANTAITNIDGDSTQNQDTDTEENSTAATSGDKEGDTDDKFYNVSEKLTAGDIFPLKLSVPKIELEWIANEGSDSKTLKKGPGHIIETPLPGQGGRCTISGHRTTYGAPFNRIDELEKGDLIFLETHSGYLFTYVVTNTEVILPTEVYILEGNSKKELLLTTCEPEYSAINRLVVISELINIYTVSTDILKE